MVKSFLYEIFTELKSKELFLVKGENLFFQGSPVINLYYIKTGKLKLVRNTIEGGEVLLHLALSGETIAEASLFSNEYHCSAISDSVSEILVYKKVELLLHLEKHPAAMKGLLKIFAQQVRDLRAISEIKNVNSAKERILSFIRYEMNQNKEVHLEISLKDIAYKIGLAHETLYRELKTLEEAKILIRKGRYLKLL